jgi:hypothetical protein
MKFSCERDSGDRTMFFYKVDLGVEFVDSDPIAQVAIQAIGLLDQHNKATLVLTGEGDHPAEGGAAGLLCGLNIYELFGDLQLSTRGV